MKFLVKCCGMVQLLMPILQLLILLDQFLILVQPCLILSVNIKGLLLQNRIIKLLPNLKFLSGLDVFLEVLDFVDEVLVDTKSGEFFELLIFNQRFLEILGFLHV